MNSLQERPAVADMPVVLDLSATRSEPSGRLSVRAEVDVPEGWELLPAGVMRKLRANAIFLHYGGPRAPFMYEEEGGEPRPVFDLRVLGAVGFRSEQTSRGCGTGGRVWAETEAAILVRRK